MSLSTHSAGVDRDDRDDATLLRATREGDLEAYGLLFERHFDAAQRLAHSLVPGPNADDLVAESFVRVLSTLQRGGGPTEFFRAYLLTAIRRQHVDSIRRTSREQPTEDEKLDAREEFIDTAERGFEHQATAQAFASLPERWQLVLWHLDVEGQRPADIAPMLNMTPNAVSALAYRAREGLRQAYLQHHIQPSTEQACSETINHLGAYVRQGLAKRDRAKVDAHLDECRGCLGLMFELREFNEGLGAILAPALLGSGALGYLASVSPSATASGLLASATPRDASGAAATSSTTAMSGAATGILGAVTALAPAGVAAAVIFVAGAAGLAATQDEPVASDAIVATTPIPTGDYSLPWLPGVLDDETLSLTGSDNGTDNSGGTAGPEALLTGPQSVVPSEPSDRDSEATTPGNDGASEPGANPGTDTSETPGSGPSTNPGTNPNDDAEPGTNPGTDPGTPPGDDEPGTDPGDTRDPGTNPGTPPGGHPGTQPGDDPEPGTNPGDEPGDEPDPGTDPGTNPGDDPEPGDTLRPEPDDPGFCDITIDASSWQIWKNWTFRTWIHWLISCHGAA